MKQKRIAFIHHPQNPNLRRLESIPFALNAVISLAKTGWDVDLYLWEEPSDNINDLLPVSVTVRYCNERDLMRFSRRFSRLQPLWHQLHFKLQSAWQQSYYCVFGLGQIGAYIANFIAKANQCPFIYLNDEFPCTFGNSRWTQREKEAVKSVAMVVVLDSVRFHPLCEELDISKKPYAVLPNIAVVKHPDEKINWHEILGIPKDCIPFLHAGSIADWSQVPELLSTLPHWPDKAVLILHSAYNQEVERYRKELAHLEVPGKVFWSNKPLPESQLNSLVSYCAGNFALYRNFGRPVEYLGFSSGKLLRSLAYGTPVIASKDPMLYLSFVEDNQLGVLVNHPCEIPAAVEKLINNKHIYQDRCLQFVSKHLSFEKAWIDLCEKLNAATRVDLLHYSA